VRRFAASLGTQVGLDETRAGRVAIIVNELGANLARYASDGRLLCRVDLSDGYGAVEILSIDRGPGLDAAQVLADGFTTGTTPGTGLGAVKRLADTFDIYSQRGKGTAIVARVAVAAAERAPSYEVGAVSTPVHGEVVSGDGWVVRQAGDRLEALVVDGLGHGPAANRVALEAIDAFEHMPPSTPDQLVQTLHGRLKSTRGGAVFAVAVSPGSIAYTGVGNVRAAVMGAGPLKTLITHTGTAGVQMRTLRAAAHPWDGNGQIILHTDGITSTWTLDAYPGLALRHPALVAAVVFRDFCRGKDDATVVAIRRRP
jgi:anti-sigma regulatory factor (Ser/Thr protein kinase)